MPYIQTNEDGSYSANIPEGIPIYWDSQNFCTVEALVFDGKAEQFRVYPLTPVSAPSCDAMTQGVRALDPAVVDGAWTQQWEVVNLSPEQVAANQAAKETNDARLVAEKIEALWQAADRYTSSYISGVAIGILTIGVMQQKPKALAVSAWSSAVWAEYYARKALVTATSVDNHDFSSFGPIPHSVPELQAEVGL